MQLTEPEVLDWIARLKTDIEATAIAQPSGLPFDRIDKPAVWRIGIYASAFFYIPQDSAVRIAEGIPALHARFQKLTGSALTIYQNGNTGGLMRRYTQEKLEATFRKGQKDEDIASINGYDGGSKESSPGFAMSALADFEALSRRGGERQIMSFFNVRLPFSFWQTHRADLRAWWLDALELLAPEQAYLGLAFANPPILERWPLVESAELALAKAFYGLEVDKPFFMVSSRRDGIHLESGQRTPAFGVLLHGESLAKLGGKAVVEASLRDSASEFRLTPCLDGWWVEAGNEPRLYPVEEGRPPLPAALAKLTQPLRLDCLRLVSYNPNVVDERRFTPACASRWLRRFDDGSDWPAAENSSAA